MSCSFSSLFNISKPYFVEENDRFFGLRYHVDFTVSNYRSLHIEQGDVFKSSAFYLGNEREFEGQVLLYPKGHCLKRCKGGFCAYLSCIPRTGDDSSLEGTLEVSVKNYGGSGMAFVGIWGADVKEYMETWIWGCCSKTIDLAQFLSNAGSLTVNFIITLDVDVSLRGVATSPTPSSLSGCLSDDLGVLVRSTENCDVTLVAAEGRECKAHKLILCARSPVFRQMFLTDMCERQCNRVDIPDMTLEELEGLLSYLYTDHVPNMADVSDNLLIAADKYQLEGLKVMCEEAIGSSLTVENAPRAFLLADLHRSVHLKQRVVTFIKRHGDRVFSSDHWRVVKELYPLSVVSAFF